MIRARGYQADGKMVVLIGLEPENIKTIVEDDDPVLFNLRKLGGEDAPPVMDLPDIDVIIFDADGQYMAHIMDSYFKAGDTDG